ncbi:hypothetical protein DFS34DRAFT_31534 [Phlyctochytrium arcticum]|nr:hypothetical protein DFS34DRAFT_31534 [Phlyctochytrium arcticum]
MLSPLITESSSGASANWPSRITQHSSSASTTLQTTILVLGVVLLVALVLGLIVTCFNSTASHEGGTHLLAEQSETNQATSDFRTGTPATRIPSRTPSASGIATRVDNTLPPYTEWSFHFREAPDGSDDARLEEGSPLRQTSLLPSYEKSILDSLKMYNI